MLRWRDIEKKKFAKKPLMIKPLTRNLHYVFKSLGFITQRKQSFLKQHSYLHLWFHEKFKISSYHFWLPYAFIGLTKCKLQTMMLMPTQFPTWPIREKKNQIRSLQFPMFRPIKWSIFSQTGLGESGKIQNPDFSFWAWTTHWGHVLSLKTFPQISVLSWEISYSVFQPVKFDNMYLVPKSGPATSI